MEHIPVSQARSNFAEILVRAAYQEERIVITKHGKEIAALVPFADLKKLESMEAVSTVDKDAMPAPDQDDMLMRGLREHLGL